MQNHRNAIVLFTHSTQIDRTDRDNAFTGLPWNEIEAVYSAMFDDVLESASHVEFADIFVYRDADHISDDFTQLFSKTVTCRQVQGKIFSDQVYHALEEVTTERYSRIVAVLENHPLIQPPVFKRVFDQLKYEDDCIVLGPTVEGSVILFGMKSNHSTLFSATSGDPILDPALLMQRLCEKDVMVFPIKSYASVSSTINFLRVNADTNEGSAAQFMPKRTYSMFKLFDRKYKTKRTVK